jgi:hypothetical protein
MDNRNGSPFAAIQVLVVIAIVLIAFWVVMWPYAKIYNRFMTNDSYETKYVTAEQCQQFNGYWENNQCHELPTRAKELITFQRQAWLATPFILITGLIIWFFTLIFKKDTNRYQL